MARVYNWQIGREMSYWYPESRPKRQFAAVFDINKCIACQTCTLACKTTWTSGKGQEYMLWNNVESKPYGFYPLAWDLKLLRHARRRRSGTADSYAGRTIFEAAPAGERVLGWRPERARLRLSQRGRGRLRRVRSNTGASLQVPAPDLVLLPGAHLQPLHLSGLPGLLPARLDLQAARGRHRAGRPRPLPRLPRVHQGLPLQEGLLQSADRHVGEVHRLLSRRSSRACSRSASSTASARSAWPAGSRTPDNARARQPDRLPRARAEGGVAAVPAVRPGAERLLHPADPRPGAVPAADVRARRRQRPSRPTARPPTTRTWPACSACSARTERVVPRWKRQDDWVIGPGRERQGDRPRAAPRAGLYPRGVRREVPGRPQPTVRKETSPCGAMSILL